MNLCRCFPNPTELIPFPSFGGSVLAQDAQGKSVLWGGGFQSTGTKQLERQQLHGKNGPKSGAGSSRKGKASPKGSLVGKIIPPRKRDAGME